MGLKIMNLDNQQQQAVETNSKKALVLSGAGSGKTRVLIERIAHLIETEHVSPYEVMAFVGDRVGAFAFLINAFRNESFCEHFVHVLGEHLVG